MRWCLRAIRTSLLCALSTLLIAADTPAPHQSPVALKKQALLCAQRFNEQAFAQVEAECTALLPYLETQLGPDAPEVAQTLEFLGAAFSQQGKYGQAEMAYKRTLSIREVKNGPGAPETLEALHRLASNYVEQDKFALAEPLLLRWVEHTDPRPLSTVDKLIERLFKDTEAAMENEKFSRAGVLLDGAIALSDRNGGPMQHRVLDPLTWLGRIRFGQKRLDEARRIFERAIDLQLRLLPNQPQRLALRLLDLAQLLELQYDVKRALATFMQARNAAAKVPGCEEEALSNNFLCAFLQKQQMYPEAEAPCRSAVAQWEKQAPSSETTKRLLKSRVNLASLLHRQRNFAEAEGMLLRVHKELQQDKQSRLTATVLNNLGSLYQAWQKDEKAERSYHQALEAATATQDTETAAICQHNLATLKMKQGRLPEALEHANRALALTRSITPVDEVQIASRMASLAAINSLLDRADLAREGRQQVLAILERRLGPEHAAVAEALSNLALSEKDLGNYREAEKAYKRALAIHEARKDQISLARVMANLSTLWGSAGEWVRADRSGLQALEIRIKVLGKDHPDVASSLNSLAVLYRAQGEFEQALAYAQQAVRSAQQGSGTNPLDVAHYENNLGAILEDTEQYDRAMSAHDRALALQQKSLHESHIDIMTTQNALGSLAYLLRDYKKAEAIFRNLADALKKRSSTSPAVMVPVLNNLALSILRQGEPQRAEPIFLAALNALTDAPGFTGPEVELIWSNISTLRLALGQVDAALTALRRTVARQEIALKSSLSESRTLALLSLQRGTEDAVYGLLQDHAARPAARALAMELTLLRKGRTLDVGSTASRAIRRSLQNPMQKEQFQSWREILDKRQRALLLGPRGQSPEEYEKMLQELRIREGQLYHQLALAAPGAGLTQNLELDQIVAQVASRLPKGSTLLEVVRAKPLNAKANAQTSLWGEPQYVALLLHPDSRIAVGKPVSQKLVDGQVAAALTQLSKPSGSPQSALQKLYSLLIQPLEAELRDTKRLYISVEGSLNLLPWDALYDGSRYMIDQYEIHLLTSGRDLLQPAQKGSGRPPLILANPDFGVPADGASDAPAIKGMYALMQGLQRLPWAAIEAQFIAGLFKTPARLDGKASESTLRAAPAPTVLHIATHGVFRVEGSGAGGDGTRSVSRTLGLAHLVSLDESINSVVFRQSLDPLSNSALALAGAARAAQSPDSSSDGILTAAEVRELDMQGTELVTLSACETARGSLAIGQGVYGLRRAFLVAGAQTLVSSLWKVADEQTSILMRSYYSRLLNGRPRVSALREAMLDMKVCNPHPYYWAPFVAIGMDAPLSKAYRSPTAVYSCKDGSTQGPN